MHCQLSLHYGNCVFKETAVTLVNTNLMKKYQLLQVWYKSEDHLMESQIMIPNILNDSILYILQHNKHIASNIVQCKIHDVAFDNDIIWFMWSYRLSPSKEIFWYCYRWVNAISLDQPQSDHVILCLSFTEDKILQNIRDFTMQLLFKNLQNKAGAKILLQRKIFLIRCKIQMFCQFTKTKITSQDSSLNSYWVSKL